jgi:YhcH/YjgK/YiaL family protein
MILDNLSNASLYFNMHPLFKQAFDWLSKTDLLAKEDGKYELDGEKLFAIVQSYETKSADAEQMEAHKRYIDIQYMVRGEEQIGHSILKEQRATREYSTSDDYWLTDAAPSFFSKLEAGNFMIFYPTDLHMPCIFSGTKQTVKKVVIKVEI